MKTLPTKIKTHEQSTKIYLMKFNTHTVHFDFKELQLNFCLSWRCKVWCLKGWSHKVSYVVTSMISIYAISYIQCITVCML